MLHIRRKRVCDSFWRNSAAKVSRTVLESGGSREGVADFNSCCGCLGKRNKDAFYCINQVCGVVLQADWNAAVNIKLRKNDPEIGRGLRRETFVGGRRNGVRSSACPS
jgi:hypothetical protein